MGQDVIDVHIHFGAPEDGQSGCYWSKEFEESLAFLAMRLVTDSLFKKVTFQGVKDRLLRVINRSQYVAKSVLLALDEVYDENGQVHRDLTHLCVPNDCIIEIAAANPRVLFGASVHPYRPDWEARLDECLENKAVLCKWVPSSQRIDPQHSKCLPFYKKLAETGLPLLCHVGPEKAIPPFDDALQNVNRPSLLRTALDTGVTVIMAHAALPLLPPPLEDDSYFRELVALVEEADARDKDEAAKKWRLYADLSAINLGPRNFYIDEVKKHIPVERLIFGSDYPIPILDISQKPHISIWHWLKHFFQTVAAKNPLDKNYLLIKNMDFGDALFTNASGILRLG